MVVYKLGGFVSDQKAKLVEVTPKRALLQLGTRGLLPFWGRTETKQPVDLEIEFGEPETAPGTARRAASRRVRIDVTIRPAGWVRDPDLFERRARNVLKTLRGYFVAE
ncbi:MAG TPA: hypothetical protein EYP14_02790 [Planctomycetaceae bacterium]|nr:hypothetical protein [Planctomycetaceae bacterium]